MHFSSSRFLLPLAACIAATASLGVRASAAPAATIPAAAIQAAPVYDLIENVRVEGNQRIEARTVLSYLGLFEGSRFTQGDIDRALKNLFATGFFADVKLLRDNHTLVVQVVENPVVNRVTFEGNSHLDTKDLEKEIELKARAIYTKTRVQGDVKRILDLYRRSGRYSATVSPKVVALDQNRVDLVFEISEGPTTKIEKIAFIGNNTFSGSDLRKVIRSSEERWYRFLSDDDKYDPDRLEYDQELLRRYYTSQGYADFQVRSAQAELSPARDAFFLTFVLEEGPRYALSKVEVKSELKESQPLDFSPQITTKTGDIYDSSAIEGSIDAITKELGNRGYAFVNVEPKLERNRDAKTIELSYVIKPGPRVYVERINVGGNVRTLDEVIRREFRLAEGDPYNAAKLARTEQRLNNLGFFEKVEVKNVQGNAPDKAAIDVTVQEKSTGEINLGAGFSSTDGPLADIGVKETNFLGRGQELRSRLTYAARRKQVDFGFTEPYFLNRELAAGFDIYRTQFEVQNNSTYSFDSKGITLHAGYNLREKLQHSLNYTLRDNTITDVREEASRFIRDQQGRVVTSSVGHAITYDGRNNKFDPTEGFYLKVSQDVAGLGGDAKYIRHELRTSYYYPLAKSWTLSASGSGGNIIGISGDHVRISDRFFLGGDSLRGFENAGVGPRDITTQDALGGENYYTSSAEMRFPLGLPEELGIGGAIFADAGSLWKLSDNGPEVRNDNSVRASAGFGISWASPFGPVRIDFAKAIARQKYDETQLFRFSFGTRF